MSEEIKTETVQETTVQTDVNTEQKTDVSIDNGTNTDTEPKTDSVTDTKPEGETKTDDKKKIMIPKERFDEVNQKYKELASQLEEMKKAKEEMERQLAEMKQASEQTRITIQETTSKLEEQVKHYEALMNEMVETKLKQIPENMRDLVPEGLSIEQKLAWINKAEAKGLFKKPQQVVIGQPLNHSSEQDKVERMRKMSPLQLLSSFYASNK